MDSSVTVNSKSIIIHFEFENVQSEISYNVHCVHVQDIVNIHVQK